MFNGEQLKLEVGTLVEDIHRLRKDFEGVKASFVRRIGNSAAHLVAKDAVRGSGIRTWEFYPPLALIFS